ncbi:MAG: hypothetical protein L6R39_007122 [Caloplaca ligustica]|nr:MAG: hypothetical protein L6R39_007122 [Caloplaca ligustica]
MEHVIKFRTALFETAAKEFKAFERSLREDFANREEVHRFEIRRLQEEISSLRQQASQTKKLEHELGRPRAHSARGDGANLGARSSSTDNEQTSAWERIPSNGEPTEGRKYVTVEYDELYQRFLACSLELDRVKSAHGILTERARQWRDDAYRTVHRITPRRQELRRSGHNTARTTRPRSAPAGQSPVQAGFVHSKTVGSEHASLEKNSTLHLDVERSRDSLKTVQDQILSSSNHTANRSCQGGLHSHADDSGPPSSETQDDDDGEPSAVSDYQLPVPLQHNDGVESKPSVKTETVAEPHSDIPVVTSARSLKRKRGKSPVKPAQITKTVKEELSSSSPIPPHASTRANGVQESIDLDDIANRLLTPRKDQSKRQRISTTPVASPSLRTRFHIHHDDSLLFQDDSRLLGDVDDEVPVLDSGKSSDRDTDDVRDEAWCRKEGKRYAAQLLEDMQMQRRADARAKQKRHNEGPLLDID